MSLLRSAGRVAAASAVHGRVQRRQQQRWAAQDQAAAAQAQAQAQATQPPAPAPEATPAAAPMDFDTKIAQLEKLGELRDKGILTDVEFEVQKARLLAS